MAKPIKLSKNREFTFAPTAGRGQESKYPWDEWLNGSLLLLERSTGVEGPKGTIEDITEKRDYEVPTGHMPPKLMANNLVCHPYRFDQLFQIDPGVDAHAFHHVNQIFRRR